jgi:acetyltransferase
MPDINNFLQQYQFGYKLYRIGDAPMDRLFYPDSIAIFGLSSKTSNIPKLVLENLIRWGFKGRIFGINPRGDEAQVSGIRMYKSIAELPIVPDLAFILIPARFVPDAAEECGQKGVKWLAIPSGGFNEIGASGEGHAERLLDASRKHGMRFIGPNGVTVANTANGLCLPFVPSFPPPKGGISVISQSGGVGLMLWNLMADENIGMAKFASIGNKLDLDEVDFLKYFGCDPETKIICMYLENIRRGKLLVETARKISKPIIVLKSNTSIAGKKAAMSHTAALSNDDDVVCAAFEEAGIIRINQFTEFISVAKAFELPPMRGNRIMLMSPAGGFTVMMADLCEKLGFEFADPGADFFEGLKEFSNAGVINFANPLDMGDIYDPQMYAHIFYSVMHNENVDGGIYLSQWPDMPRGEDVFYKMFHTDLSKEFTGTMLSSGKPIGACIFGLSKTISTIKKNINFPIFNSGDEMVFAMRKQSEYNIRKMTPQSVSEALLIDFDAANTWISNKKGVLGEESLDLLMLCGINACRSRVAANAEEAETIAEEIGFPVALKLVSPDALHKTDVGGVILGIEDKKNAAKGFHQIRANLEAKRPGAKFCGVRIAKQAGLGIDMFIGAVSDQSFGPVVMFGYGGIDIEIFHDTRSLLCPAVRDKILAKLKELKCYHLIAGTRGRKALDIEAYIDSIIRVSQIMNRFERITEFDANPVRLSYDGGILALDARMRLS